MTDPLPKLYQRLSGQGGIHGAGAEPLSINSHISEAQLFENAGKAGKYFHCQGFCQFLSGNLNAHHLTVMAHAEKSVSNRIDVPPVDVPDTEIPKPGVDYFDRYGWDYITQQENPLRVRFQELLKGYRMEGRAPCKNAA